MPILSTPKWQRYLRHAVFAIFIGATLGFVIFIATSQGLRTLGGGRVGGDFPPFYGAAQIVREGNGRLLYEFSVQRQSQAGLYPEEGSWLVYPYPPVVAAAYLPFAFLDFKTAYVLHTLLMAFCCVLALVLLRRHLAVLDRNFAVAVSATLTFYPLFRAIVGGQNTPLSLLCAAGAGSALASRREAAAGLWLGAWLFKPQLAAPVILLVLLTGYYRVLPAVCGMALVYYAVGWVVTGPDWPLRWIYDVILPYAPVNLEMDRMNGVSLREVSSQLGVPILGWLLVVAGALLVVRGAWRSRNEPIALMGIAVAAAVLLSPHSLYYDGGLAVIGLAAAADISGDRGLPYFVTSWLLGGAQHIRPYLPVPPMTIVLAGVPVWLDRLIGRTRRSSS